MKIALFDDKLNVSRGGSNFSLDLLARYLSREGHQVSIITFNFGHQNKLPESFPYDVIPRPVNSDNRLLLSREIYEEFTYYRNEFDIYHVFNPAILPIAGRFRQKHDTAVVGRLNNYKLFCTNVARMDGQCHYDCSVWKKYRHENANVTEKLPNIPKYAFDTVLTPRLLNATDRLFALSPTVAEVFKGIGVNEDKMTVVPNFYDPRFENNQNYMENVDTDISLLYVGVLQAHKGVEMLIEAAKSLDESVTVDIVGNGPQREELERMARTSNYNCTVNFHGWMRHEDLPTMYNKANIFIHPGLWPEPFGRTLLEAMQYNCAFLVSNTGAPPWVIDNCGDNFRPGDAHDLQNKLNALIKDQDRRLRYRSNCNEQIEKYSPDKVIDDITNHYNKIINADNGG